MNYHKYFVGNLLCIIVGVVLFMCLLAMAVAAHGWQSGWSPSWDSGFAKWGAGESAKTTYEAFYVDDGAGGVEAFYVSDGEGGYEAFNVATE